MKQSEQSMDDNAVLEAAKNLLAEHPRLKVSRVAAGAHGKPLALALFAVATGSKMEWTLAEWEAALTELANCADLVGDFLTRESE
jgi:hypothetical protein